jgi:D-alanyl-D-alanine carboxypeptidase
VAAGAAELGADSRCSRLGLRPGHRHFGGFLGHNGGIFGYSTIALHQSALDATIVVLVNRGNTEGGDADAIFTVIAQTLFPERLAE